MHLMWNNYAPEISIFALITMTRKTQWNIPYKKHPLDPLYLLGNY